MSNKKSNIDIGDRLRLVRKETGLTQAQFGKSLGVGQTLVSELERGSTNLTETILLLLQYRYLINPQWLLHGEGQMFVDRLKEQDHLNTQLDLGNYRFVPLLQSQVTAGPEGEILYEDINDYYPFKTWWIEKLVGKGEERKKQLLLVRVRGMSMTPTINPGEMALVDTSDQARLEIKPGRIYLVLRADGTTAMKRVVISKEDGKPKIVCLSDNPAQTPFEIEVEPGKPLKCYILGRVIWVGKEFY